MTTPEGPQLSQTSYDEFAAPAELAAHLAISVSVDWPAVVERAATMEREEKEGAGLLGVIALQQYLADTAPTASPQGVARNVEGVSDVSQAAYRIDQSAANVQASARSLEQAGEEVTGELRHTGRSTAAEVQESVVQLRSLIGQLEEVLSPYKIRELSDAAANLQASIGGYKFDELINAARNMAVAANQNNR